MSDPDTFGTSDFELLKAKAEAKVALNPPNRPAYIAIEWVESEGRNEDGSQAGRPLRESTYALLQVAGAPERDYFRRDDETLEEFIKRVSDDAPAVSQAPAVIQLLPEPPAPAAPQPII
jgi:hypothetical protein